MRGWVSLVGAGPGDVGLITVRGLECTKRAEVLVYDRLVNETLLDYAPADAERIYVGKSPGHKALEQEQINALLVQKAKEGKYVVRLKGGDPFVFGRGGEEALAVAQAGVPFDVVPGVTSATAVPAYAGIPVTHRGLSTSVTIITGHEDPTKPKADVDWAKLSNSGDTLILLMGLGNLEDIVRQVIQGGRSPDTPVALVRWGTTSRQETLEGTLGDIASKAQERGLTPPVVVVMGEVVQLRQHLRWFDQRPLFGKRVLVTRSRKQASALSARLALEGAEVIELPAVEIQQENSHLAALDSAIQRLDQYRWAVFTSVNGVDAFFQRLEAQGKTDAYLKNLRVCVIGPATAAALERRGLKVEVVPPQYVAEAILAEFKNRDIGGQRFLLPRAAEARPVLVEGLRKLGAIVDEVPAYRSTLPSEKAARAIAKVKRGEIDIATFASSSTVNNLSQMLNGSMDALKSARIACIGPVTARTAQELGLKPDIVAEEHTIPGLVNAIVQYIRSRP